jgi:hypothetical protein
MALTRRGSSMNAKIRIGPRQSGQSNGSNSNTFLMKRALFPRAFFAAAMSSEGGIGIGPSGCFSVS